MEEVTEAITEREELFPMEAGDELPVNTVGDVIMKLDRAKYFEQKADARSAAKRLRRFGTTWSSVPVWGAD